MFAHQVIDGIALLPSDKISDEARKAIINGICSAQHFHMGIQEDVYECLNIKDGMECFKNDLGNLHLPYHITWFDAYTKQDDVSKLAILATEDKEKKYISCISFAFMEKRWGMCPVFIHIKQDTGEIFFRLISTEMGFTEELLKNEVSRGMFDSVVTALNCFLLLLSCKNITTENILPPAKLNVKRKKNNKCPLFTYKTLVLKPTTQYEKSIPQHLWENRIHLCRGHFKLYTKEHPLFGRFTGRYWWQPQARGNKKLGVVMKDYEVQQRAVA